MAGVSYALGLSGQHGPSPRQRRCGPSTMKKKEAKEEEMEEKKEDKKKKK